MRACFLLLFAIFCISCNKKDVTRSIDIDVSLKDDVSPVEGVISIPGQFDYIDWTFEEIYKPVEDSPNPATHKFSTEGPAKITVVAYKNATRETFIGNNEVTIPGMAKKIKITGFCFKNLLSDNPYNQRQLSISLTYQKLGTASARTISVSPATFSATDTIKFPEPVIYDIEGFENGGYSDFEVFIKIQSNQDSNLEFLSSFNLTGNYFWEHPSDPGFVFMSNVKHNQVNAIYLVCDWMPN